jgi:hypothetical protein
MEMARNRENPVLTAAEEQNGNIPLFRPPVGYTTGLHTIPFGPY